MSNRNGDVRELRRQLDDLQLFGPGTPRGEFDDLAQVLWLEIARGNTSADRVLHVAQAWLEEQMELSIDDFGSALREFLDSLG